MKVSSLSLRNNTALRNRLTAMAVALLSAPAAFAQTSSTPEASIGEALTKVLALLAIAGAAYVSISLAGVGWSVGVKFIKRMRGAA
ncbi:UNVERIFIED_ORG: hypothetical protein ABIC43_000229 [Variovorax guangxiensis]